MKKNMPASPYRQQSLLTLLTLRPALTTASALDLRPIGGKPSKLSARYMAERPVISDRGRRNVPGPPVFVPFFGVHLGSYLFSIPTFFNIFIPLITTIYSYGYTILASPWTRLRALFVEFDKTSCPLISVPLINLCYA